MGQKYVAKYIKKHENYDPDTAENDIAMIKVGPIKFTGIKITYYVCEVKLLL